MKVSECEKCPRYERHKWVQYRKPSIYHAIGQSHVFGWCNYHQELCRLVRKCDMQKEAVKRNE